MAKRFKTNQKYRPESKPRNYKDQRQYKNELKKLQRFDKKRSKPGMIRPKPQPEQITIKTKVPVEVEERFDKAFIISLCLIALFSLLIFIPFFGPLMGLTLAPYLACNRGCRYVTRRNGIQVGFLIGLVWSIIELFILFQFLRFIKLSVAEPGIQSSLDIFIIFLIFLANIIFCVLGGYTGGAKFEAGFQKTDNISKKDQPKMHLS